jgi:hypothetical protein
MLDGQTFGPRLGSTVVMDWVSCSMSPQISLSSARIPMILPHIPIHVSYMTLNHALPNPSSLVTSMGLMVV